MVFVSIKKSHIKVTQKSCQSHAKIVSNKHLLSDNLSAFLAGKIQLSTFPLLLNCYKNLQFKRGLNQELKKAYDVGSKRTFEKVIRCKYMSKINCGASLPSLKKGVA